MSSRIFSARENLDWKKAYMAAILERDHTRLPDLIRQATEKLSERLRELRQTRPVAAEELEAIQDALYSLEALISSLSYRDEMGEWTRSNLDS